MFNVKLLKKEKTNLVYGPTRKDYNLVLKEKIKELKAELSLSKKILKNRIK